MKNLIFTLLFLGFIAVPNFAQNNDEIQNQMQEMMQKMMEDFQKNFGGDSFFFSDTLMMKGFEGMPGMPLDGNPFFFSDTLMIDGFGGGTMPDMPKGLGLDLGQLLEEMQRGMQQMTPEDWEQLNKMFEGLDLGGGFMMPSPEDLEKFREQFTPPSDSAKQKRKTIRL